MALLQRRALRVAFHYLRNADDADEAVQDAFVKVFLHIEQYREDLSFDVWFTRILVNASLDRLKARTRQQRFVAPTTDDQDERSVEQVPATERLERAPIAGARAVGAGVAGGGGDCPTGSDWCSRLSHVDEQTPGEIAAATGMSAGHGAGAPVPGAAEVARQCWESRHDVDATNSDARLADALDAYRAAAHAEADAPLRRPRARAQRARILARLEQAGPAGPGAALPRRRCAVTPARSGSTVAGSAPRRPRPVC